MRSLSPSSIIFKFYHCNPISYKTTCLRGNFFSFEMTLCTTLSGWHNIKRTCNNIFNDLTETWCFVWCKTNIKNKTVKKLKFLAKIDLIIVKINSMRYGLFWAHQIALKNRWNLYILLFIYCSKVIKYCELQQFLLIFKADFFEHKMSHYRCFL